MQHVVRVHGIVSLHLIGARNHCKIRKCGKSGNGVVMSHNWTAALGGGSSKQKHSIDTKLILCLPIRNKQQFFPEIKKTWPDIQTTLLIALCALIFIKRKCVKNYLLIYTQLKINKKIKGLHELQKKQSCSGSHLLKKKRKRCQTIKTKM